MIKALRVGVTIQWFQSNCESWNLFKGAVDMIREIHKTYIRNGG